MMRRLITSVFVAAVIIGGSVAVAAQSKPAPPKYNPAAETFVAGTIVDVVSLADAEGGVGVHLVIKTDKGPVTVRVGPAMFIGMNNFSFLVDDKVEVVGARASRNGTVLLARLIKQKERTLTLRDEAGTPAWTPNIDGTDGCGVAHSTAFVGSEG